MLADVEKGGAAEVERAIAAARAAHGRWSRTPWHERVAIFLRAAELIAGPWRATMNAATMLEPVEDRLPGGDRRSLRVDRLPPLQRRVPRAHLRGAADLVAGRRGTGWSTGRSRASCFAISPFNFTAIGANLTTSPALMGNTVVWKPASTQALSAWTTLRVLEEAGLPPGVINLVFGPGAEIGAEALASPELAGVHFTGSTGVFHTIWSTIGNDVGRYRNYPRIVGETGGKDFILAHPSADPAAVVHGDRARLLRVPGPEVLGVLAALHPLRTSGARCATASTARSEASRWATSATSRTSWVPSSTRRPSTTQRDAIAEANAAGAEIVAGGGTDDSEGWFVEPTVIKTDDPDFRLLRDELFGPVVTAYVYDESKWAETLDLVDSTGSYALTGAVFANDRYAIDEAHQALRYAAGNFYVNDKPTGAVVGQQPFGGARASGTNDKAGSMWNLIRWVSPAHDQGDARAGDRLPLPLPAAGRMRRALPGLALAGAGVAVSLSAHWAFRALPPLVLCVGLGIVVANVLRVPVAAVPGLRLAAGPVLKLGVVLLGLDLVFPDILALGLKALVVVVAVVAITFFGTRWAGNGSASRVTSRSSSRPASRSAASPRSRPPTA